MIDEYGFRLNVGIILSNAGGQLFWGKRIGHSNAWQFPQGGIQARETPLDAMYRELGEELGLACCDIEVIGVSQKWLYYHLPKHLRRYYCKPLCIGQKQKWFLLKLITHENAIRFDTNNTPEFESWRWVNYWHPITQVIDFKKNVYRQALLEFEPLLFKQK